MTRTEYRSAWAAAFVLAALLMPGPAGADDMIPTEEPAPQVVVAPATSKLPVEGALKDAVSNVVAYFAPARALVLREGAEGGRTSATIANSTGPLMPGMRMRVFRKGAPFVHPVTGETLGSTETPVATAQVLSASAAELTLGIVEGTVREGDLARVSSAPVSLLFYQKANLDWDLSEEYYFWLKETGRFLISDTPPGSEPDDRIVELARRAGAEVALVLSSVGDPTRLRVRQRLLWAADGREFASQDFDLPAGAVETLKLSGGLFDVERGSPVVKHSIPYSVEQIAVADFNCDGQVEIAVSTLSSIFFYSEGNTLVPAFGLDDTLELKPPLRGRIIWLDAADLDSDGCAELNATVVGDRGGVRSYLYKFAKPAAFTEHWSAEGFSRLLYGRLYVQAYGGTSKPYSGKVYTMDMPARGGAESPRSEVRLPEGLGIYSFNYILDSARKRYIAAFDATGSLSLYDSEGAFLWSSSEDFGAPRRRFESQGNALTENTYWSVPERVLGVPGGAAFIKRQATAKYAGGLGYKASQVLGLFNPGALPRLAGLTPKIDETLYDIALSGERLYLLSGSYSLNIANVLKGRRPFKTDLMTYPLHSGEADAQGK